MFSTDEITEIDRIWAYGTPGFNCLGMIKRQPGEPWHVEWRLRIEVDDQIGEASRDPKYWYVKTAPSLGDEWIEALWAMVTEMHKRHCAVLGELPLDNIAVHGGWEDLEAAYRQITVAQAHFIPTN